MIRRALNFERLYSNVQCSRRVCSQKSKGFPFNKTSFYAQLVAQGEICVLKSFSRLVMSTDVKDGFVPESMSFINNDVEECGFVLRNFSRKFDCTMKVVSLFNEQVNFLFVRVP